MWPASYEILTTQGLEELLADGRPVYAFGSDPLAGAASIDASRFAWRPLAPIDLGALAQRLGAFEPERFAGRSLRVYRASASPLASGSSR